MNKLYYTWNDLENDCRKISKRLKKDKVEYAQIVAITRGGLFVAGLLSEFLDLVPIETVSIHSYGSDDKRKDFKITKKGYSNKPTLICDDIIDTGYTAETVKKMYPNSKFIVLHYKLKNKPVIKPDYYAKDTNRWVVYPWEVKEKND